ncbi:MAG: hypothetical protein D6806_11925, partial [Deltaproteobacteria bacterium]
MCPWIADAGLTPRVHAGCAQPLSMKRLSIFIVDLTPKLQPRFAGPLSMPWRGAVSAVSALG